MELSLQFVVKIILTLTMFWVIYSDATRYTISNKLNLFVIILFFPVYFALGGMLPPLQHALGFLAFFAGGFVLFSLRALGGGDVKLLAALGLWCGWGMNGAHFAIYTALFGGVLAILLLLLRRILPFMQAKVGKAWKTMPAMFVHDQAVPYGIAIALSFLLLLWTGRIIG